MEHIKNIEIKNFKSIRHAEIKDCRRVNVFIGYPNVGKSNILEALGLFSFTQFYNNESFTLESICRFNHLSDLNFNKNVRNEIAVGINSTYELNFKKGTLKEARSNYDFGVDDYIFELSISSANNGGAPLFRIIANKEIGKQYVSPSKKEGVNDNVIDRIKYYKFNSEAEYDKAKSFSLSIPFGDNLLDILQGNSDLRREYSELLKEFNLRLNISGAEISVFKEIEDGTFVTFKHNTVSDTLRRLFFFKAAIETNNDSILLFEEPESHMFPPYMRKFTADVIFDNTNQFFIATHSPYVLGEFIEEIKEDLSVYVVDYDKGESVIKRLTDDEVTEVSQYGIDLFFNLESYLDKYGQPRSA